MSDLISNTLDLMAPEGYQDFTATWEDEEDLTRRFALLNFPMEFVDEIFMYSNRTKPLVIFGKNAPNDLDQRPIRLTISAGGNHG